MASLKVAVRVRPFNHREVEMNAKCVVQMDGKKTRLQKPKLLTIDNNSTAVANRENYNDFTFDHSYWSFEGDLNDEWNGNNNQHIVTQEEVYNDLGTDVINCAFEGYNACVFAYGQTGSGKTFTMMGTPDAPGLIPRICREMFTRMKLGAEAGTGYKTHVSYLEIYNERVKDLLGSANSGHALKVREHRTTGPYVENLSQHPVIDYKEIQHCIDRGNTLRTTASTNMNDTSSRSHAIFTITFVQAVFMDKMPSETVSKIHLVDLAGSERANATGATGDRLKEGAHINKSLVSLGSVISALAEQSQPNTSQPGAKRAPYIPYRDSVLTWLLKDSLGGNSKTIMIAAVSPADCNYSETLSTLRYSNRAKNIINKPTINEDPNVKLIRELREEINKLKNMLRAGDGMDMLEDLMKIEAQEKVLTEEWAGKWQQAQSILSEQKALGLRKSGVGVVLDSEAPHLIGIHDDISTGVTLYSLKEGETIIGNNEDEDHFDEHREVDIALKGMGILAEHCSIQLNGGHAIIHPRPGAQCWLNANLIEEATAISQGDILLLGPTNMFRYNNPAEAAKLRSVPNRKGRADLSRLSLIAASRENLNGSMFLSNDEDMFASQGLISSKRDRLLGTVEQNEDLQDDHRKILDTIKSALNKLNTERIHMNEQYKTKVQQLSDELTRLEQQNNDKAAIMNCRDDFFAAKREMVLWDKSNKKTQIDIGVTQISAIQNELEAKKGELHEFVAKEFEELEQSGKLNEMIKSNLVDNAMTISADTLSNLLLTASESLLESETDKITGQRIQEFIRKKQEEIQQVEVELIEKEELLNDNIREIAELDETILLLDDERKLLHSEMNEFSRCDRIRKKSNSNAESTNNPLDLDINSNPTDGDADGHASTSIQSPLVGAVSSRSEMNLLRQKIAAQKAQIMKNLELNNCDKTRLDDEIMKLQNLQKRFFNYEKDMQYGDEMRSEGCLSSDETELDSEIIYRDTSDENSNSSEGRIGKDKYLSRRLRDDRTVSQGVSYPASTITSRSQSSMDNHYESEYVISVPSYVIRGAGKQTHVEYEVRITLPDEKWTLLRRYSRFRELSITMKASFGERVAVIPFPRRELFSSNSESVARNRRRQLEAYLRRLLVVCSKIPQCPIYEGVGGFGLSKITLAEFSPFFKKGLFESGKHGTG